ncbi:hypothetical protein LCGC14_1981150 [marine sediment metagenome]|uniref:Pyrrolo-quinoline quinone repeat domain-containing protein n=1 Tax=marine sediment metagenome TaxID=412755 RepID=A0A0F9F960_9ZZZZ
MARTITCATKLALLAALLTSGPAFAQTEDAPWWPQFHGPKRDNMSTETGLLKQWPEGGPKVIWKFSGCGDGYSMVSIADGRIFTAGDFDDDEKIIALDLDGKPLWTANNGASWNGPYPGARTMPTYDDGLLYHMNPTGKLTALKAATGELVWSVDLKAEFGARYGMWAMAENVVVDGDRVFCIPGGSKALVAALDKRTGKTVWTSKGLGTTSAYCSPLAVQRGSRRLIVTVTSSAIVGLDAKTGATLWQRPYRNRYAVHANTPIHHDGIIYVTSGYKLGGVALKLSDDGSKITELWTDKKLDAQHGGVVLLDGHLYGAGEKTWICLELKSGNVVHEAKGVGKGSVTYADGMLYCYSERGTLGLVKASPKAHEMVSSFKVTKGVGKHWAHPVVAAGRLFIRHGDVLMAFDVKAK